MTTLGTGDRVGTLAEQVLEGGQVVPSGTTGTIIGWRGEALIVEWSTPDGETLVLYVEPNEVQRAPRSRVERNP